MFQNKYTNKTANCGLTTRKLLKIFKPCHLLITESLVTPNQIFAIL